MQAIILAAGMGKRLGEFTKDNTKCMLPVNGLRLIDRTLTMLSNLNVSRCVIVVGYQGQNLMDYIGHRYDGKIFVKYVNNPIYDKTNNIYSLSLAEKEMVKDDTILLESDLIYEENILKMLIENPYNNLALVAKYETWMDGTMVRIDDENNIINFVPKAAFNYADVDKYYKTINIYKFSKEFCRNKYIPFLEAYMKAVGFNEYYENVLSILTFLNSNELKALPISDEKWYEIDDKQDLDIAEAIFADEVHIMKKYYGRYGGFWRFPQMLDFCYLVNPYFNRSRIIDEMEANFRTLVSEYPSGMRVNTLLASKCWGVKEEYIVPGNGAAELIKALVENIEGTMGVIRPTFEEYPNRLSEDRIVSYIPQNAEFRYTIDNLMTFFGNKHVDNILLINPDNPSGNFISKDDILIFVDWCENRNIRLIIDESFVDFCEQWETSSMLQDEILEKYPHMVVMKSISKSYGIPGLRLGILSSADQLLINRIKCQVSIWNINSFAEFFMQIFTKYTKDYKHACELFIQARKDFQQQLEEIPYIHVMPSQANFFLVEVLPPYKSLDICLRMLKDHNILMSACSGKKGIVPNRYMRIAIRNHRDNERLIQALKSLIEK